MTFTDFVKNANVEADDATEQLISPRARSAQQQAGSAMAVNGPAPVFDDDPTVVLTPATGAVSAPLASQPPVALEEEFVSVDRLLYREPKSEDEILVVCAQPLLALVAELKKAVEFADVSALRRNVVSQIDSFEERALKAGAQPGEVTAARYVLCALLDETILTTPWGSRSEWSAKSLLNEFHGETWGGEKVFEILDRVRSKPAQYLSLMRLIDTCLLLGFEGRYRIVEGGRYQLEDLRAELGRLITAEKEAPPSQLSGRWEAAETRGKLTSYIPLWVVFATAAVLLVGIFGYFQFLLSGEVSPVMETLEGIDQRILNR